MQRKSIFCEIPWLVKKKNTCSLKYGCAKDKDAIKDFSEKTCLP